MTNFNFEKMPDKKTEFIKELNYYQRIVDSLVKHPEFERENLVTKITLSFLIENEKRGNKADWENTLNSLIIKMDSYKDFKELSWFLSEYIGEKYLNFLDERINQLSSDEDLRKKVELIKEGAELSLKFSNELKKEGQATSLVGIPQDYAPLWRQYI